MHSCIYEGVVSHRRFVEADHRFRQSIFLMYLDLSELDEVFRGRWLWSKSQPAIARFRRGDYLGDESSDLQESVIDVVGAACGFRPNGAVRMLTNLRYFGYLINPVTFYYCFDENGELQALVAEVTNTPWGERHQYVHDLRDGHDRSPQHAKEFHVSPFLPMDLTYRWRITEPGADLSMGIRNLRGRETVFSATMSLRRRELTDRSMNHVLLKYPLQTARVGMNIYLHAARLWWKGVTFFPHPGSQKQQVQHPLGAAAES